jgi:hypothetical protein
MIKTKRVIPRQENRLKRKVDKKNLGEAGGDLRREVRSAEEAGGLSSIQRRKKAGSKKIKMRQVHLDKK